MPTTKTVASVLAACALATPMALATSGTADAATRADTIAYTLHFQVDRYTPRTNTQARVVNHLADDLLLRYREDRALWGASAWQMVSVPVPASIDATYSDEQLAVWAMKQVNARTSARIGDIVTDPNHIGPPRVRKGGSVTVAWILDPRATPRNPWGTRKNLPQLFAGTSTRW